MPVERTLKYTHLVDSVDEAFSFVMRYLDEVGAEPTILIKPVWYVDEMDMVPEGAVTKFEVQISATTEVLVTEGVILE